MLGIHAWSIHANATPCSRNRSANFASSQFLFRISSANLYPFGSRFRNGWSLAVNSEPALNLARLKYGNWSNIGPSFLPRPDTTSTKFSKSFSQSTKTFSCVICCGTFSEKIKFFGVLAAYPLTVEADGVRKGFRNKEAAAYW